LKVAVQYLLVLLPAFCCGCLKAQCIDRPYAFRGGERLTYEVAYNWGVLWVDAGQVIFNVDTLTRDGKALFYFDSSGESYRYYDWFYKVRDRFQCYVERDGFLPFWFNRDTREGGYSVFNTYSYSWDEGKVISSTENSNKPKSVDTLDIEPCTFDVLSAIYYARNLDFSKFIPGEKIPIRFLIDGAFYELYIRYQGRELKENRNGKSYMCFKFSALLVEGTIFKGGEDLVVWVTADENKIPVMVEAKILIGSIKAYLTGYENLVSELQPAE
jgi:hypothetical protein